MTDRANPAYPSGYSRHFAVRPAFAEFFETTKLDDMKFGIRNVPGIVQENADLGVSLDPGDRINNNAFYHRRGRFGGTYPNLNCSAWRLGALPART